MLEFFLKRNEKKKNSYILWVCPINMDLSYILWYLLKWLGISRTMHCDVETDAHQSVASLKICENGRNFVSFINQGSIIL